MITQASLVDKFPHAFEFDDYDRDEVDEEEEEEDQNGHVVWAVDVGDDPYC